MYLPAASPLNGIRRMASLQPSQLCLALVSRCSSLSSSQTAAIASMTSMEINTSYPVIFTLSGIKDLWPKHLFILIFLLIYLLIILLNLTLIITILIEKTLHEPMYFFLCNLCFNGLYGTTGFYPKFIHDLFSPVQVIPFVGCIAQAYVIYSSFMCEYTTLAIMAYDRYIAICRPLEYHNIMITQTVATAIVYSWVLPFFISLPFSVILNQLPMCGSEINRVYCYFWAMVRLSCVPTTTLNVYGNFVICVFALHAAFVIVSYQRLIVACRQSNESKKRFMQTCVPHLVSLINYSITLLLDILLTRYGSDDFPIGVHYFLQLEVLIVPPLLNPLMYGLKLSKVRKRIFQMHKSIR
ncbi:olfactory receptor 51I2-like [Clarias gariepinus]|uniref:olfactory receptor 51I2-like n=1 Tax=Clarias gariepinus TaxID=13013 RepID=UPI00234C9E13|nr:olfactory receptor 51I2-like [Clarias gariepinus]